jgi:hypothetical protein
MFTLPGQDTLVASATALRRMGAGGSAFDTLTGPRTSQEWNQGQLRLLLDPGSTRPGSSNSRALRLLHDNEWAGISTDLYEGLLAIAPFVPLVELAAATVQSRTSPTPAAERVRVPSSGRFSGTSARASSRPPAST